MKLTIIKEDNSVGKDGKIFGPIDLSACSFPENFWALQWDGSKGHIEYNSPMIQNDEITELPAWTSACLDAWQSAYDEEQAEIAAAEQAAILAAEQAAAEQAAAE